MSKLKKTLEATIDPNWKSSYDDEDIKYKIYDLHTPHCDDAVTYTEVGGKIRYTCTHEQN